MTAENVVIEGLLLHGATGGYRAGVHVGQNADNGTYYTGYLGIYYSDHNLTDSDINGVRDDPYRVLSSYGFNLIVEHYPLADLTYNYTNLNEGPSITIGAPGDGSSFFEDDGAITLSAGANDLEDGDLSSAIVLT